VLQEFALQPHRARVRRCQHGSQHGSSPDSSRDAVLSIENIASGKPHRSKYRGPRSCNHRRLGHDCRTWPRFS
jgi:hypothetical protein